MRKWNISYVNSVMIQFRSDTILTAPGCTCTVHGSGLDSVSYRLWSSSWLSVLTQPGLGHGLVPVKAASTTTLLWTYRFVLEALVLKREKMSRFETIRKSEATWSSVRRRRDTFCIQEKKFKAERFTVHFFWASVLDFSIEVMLPDCIVLIFLRYWKS